MSHTKLPSALLAGLLLLAAARPAQSGDAALDVSYLREHAETRGYLLGRPLKPKVTPDNKSVLFLRGEAKSPRLKLYEFSVAAGTTREVLSPETLLKGAQEHLSPEEKARRERMRVSAGGFADYQLSKDGSKLLVSLSGRLYVVDRASSKATELHTAKGTIQDPKFSPDGKLVGYVSDHDVYAYDLESGRETRVTAGGTAVKTHGLAEFVAQEEMHRFSGYWFSPDAKHVAYEEADHHGVEVWHVADPNKPDQPPQPQYYPRPGKRNVAVRLGVAPVAGGPTAWAKWDHNKYPYLVKVDWDKHGGLTLVVQTRLQNEVVLLKADPDTGATTALLTEKSATWVNVRQDVPKWTDDGKQFLWVSDHEPAPALEVRDAGGQLVGRPLGTTNLGVRELVAASPDGRTLVVSAAPLDHAPESQLFRLRLDADGKTLGAAEPLTAGGGQHSAVFSRDLSVWVRTTTTPAHMATSTVLHADRSVVGELPSAALNPPWTPRVEFTKVRANELEFDAAVVRPRDFAAGKKYPVILDVYGGPGHQHVLRAMRNWLLPQWMADQGFIVVAVDNRGTPNRGTAWEKSLYEKFGSLPIEDQVAGLKALGERFGELDMGRVGAVGWSFGGYMGAVAVLKRPDVFRAAVAGAPVTAWEDYDTHYTERYMGLPETSRAAYEDGDLTKLAAKLERPLLLIHGTADDNVYFRHTLRLTDALFRAGKDFEVLPLPSLTHMVPDPAVTQNLWAKVVRHFRRHLGVAR